MAKVRVLVVRGGRPSEEVKALVAVAGFEVIEPDLGCAREDEQVDEEPAGQGEAEAEIGEATSERSATDGPGPEDGSIEPDAASATAGGGAGTGGDETVVVVLETACVADPGFADAMRRAVARGAKVIGLWPPQAERTDVPQAFEDFGHDTIPWDPVRLRDAVTAEVSDPMWLDPTGTRRPPPKTKRNKC